jgi:uncharacterized ParB-like nuclease family protein
LKKKRSNRHGKQEGQSVAAKDRTSQSHQPGHWGSQNNLSSKADDYDNDPDTYVEGETDEGEVDQMMILIKAIRRDFQEPCSPSDSNHDERVSGIAQRLQAGEDPPEPIVVRYDGENYWLQDGFHRVEAALSIGRVEIEAEVIPGTLADIQGEHDRMKREMRGKW